MESQHSAVQHEDLTLIDNDGGFVMDFSIDIVEDVPAEVENVMHLATVGLFKEAREAAGLTMERYLDHFPVLIEFLRLLYDQGDYQSLRDHVNRALTAKWDDEQFLLLSLFEELTFVHSHGYSHNAFQRINLRISVVQKLNSTALKAMSEEQVSITLTCYKRQRLIVSDPRDQSHAQAEVSALQFPRRYPRDQFRTLVNKEDRRCPVYIDRASVAARELLGCCQRPRGLPAKS
jgi:hypothetical protein